MQIHFVTDFDQPELAPYATLRQHEGHREAGIFVAEGARVVRRLLESDFGVVSVLLPEKWRAEFEPLIQARREDVRLYVMEIAQLEKLTGFPFFQGVLAVGRIPHTPTLEDILRTAPRPLFMVACDGLSNSENIGLIVRSSAAFGAHALLVGETSGSPFLRRAVRNSMGAIFRLPIIQTESLIHSLQVLRAHGVQTIAAHPHPGGQMIQDQDFTGNCCILLGSEGPGLTQEVLAACDTRVAIPMHNDVDSINVGSAAAVFLYEAARQRQR